jgi:hypothetical protein
MFGVTPSVSSSVLWQPSLLFNMVSIREFGQWSVRFDFGCLLESDYAPSYIRLSNAKSSIHTVESCIEFGIAVNIRTKHSQRFDIDHSL